MSKFSRDDVYAAVAFIALFALAWQLLVTNHQRNVERDKFYAAHCKRVEESRGLFTRSYKCADGTSNGTE